MLTPKMAGEEKEHLIRAFAGAIRDIIEYIPGPDIGTDETCMARMKNEIGRAVGLPREIGGIPLDEIGAEEEIRENTSQVLKEATSKGILPREAAMMLATQRVKKAMCCRRWSLF